MIGIRQRRKLRIRTILLLIVSTSFLTPNYLGVSLNGVSGLETEHKTNKILEQTNSSTPHADGNSFSITMPTGAVVLMSLIFIISPILTIIWLQFLQDQAFDKQCLENSFFRDLIKLNNACVCIWSFLAFSVFIFEESKDRFLLISITKYLTLSNETIFFMLMLYLSLISSMRLYAAYFNVLDPLDNFLGEDERLSLILIRLSILMMSIIRSGILLFNSTQPILYYKFIDKAIKWKDIPRGSGILYGIDMAFFALCAILFAVGKIYQWSEQSKHRAYILGSRTIIINLRHGNRANTPNEPNQEPSASSQESGKGKWFNGREVALPNILILLSGLLMTVLILLQCLDVISLDIWWIVTGFVGMQGVVFPTMVILWYDNLRRYCFRQVTYHISILNGSVYRLFHSNPMSRNAIHPFEQL
jgi:hypothetical protein